MGIEEEYLGDGLYVSHDGRMVKLRAPRESGDHWVGLEPQTLNALMRWLLENQLIAIEGNQ
jgi:hypothetical protein